MASTKHRSIHHTSKSKTVKAIVSNPAALNKFVNMQLHSAKTSATGWFAKLKGFTARTLKSTKGLVKKSSGLGKRSKTRKH